MLPVFAKGRVLLLDDDASIQRLVSTLLKRDGYRVTVVDSGRAAIEALKKKKFDVFLLDIMMPHEGGMTVIRHLREHAAGELKRVILLTATPTAVLKSVDKDVFAIISKPFVAEELIETVRRVNG